MDTGRPSHQQDPQPTNVSESVGSPEEHGQRVDGELRYAGEDVRRERGNSRFRVPLIVAGAVVAMIVVAVGIMVVRSETEDSARGSTLGPRGSATAPGGWRLESSLGIELAVPGDWMLNSLECGIPVAATIVRAPIAQAACVLPTTPEVDYVWIGTELDALRLDDSLSEGPRLELGAAGFDSKQTVEGISAKNVIVDDVWVQVHVSQPDIAGAIIESIRRVIVDHNGCPSSQPKLESGNQPPQGELLPNDIDEISVCGYSPTSKEMSNILRASWTYNADQQAALLAAIANAPPGRNDDAPQGSCGFDAGTLLDAILIVRESSGTNRILAVRFSGCVDRGIDDGVRASHVTKAIVATIMDPLSTAYQYSGDIPTG